MNMHLSRRHFFRQSGRSGAALGVVAGFGVVGSALAAPRAPDPERRDDLLETLGKRVGVEVSDMIGSSGATLSLTVLDAAGRSCMALRDGLKAPIAHADRAHASQELQVPHAHHLAVASYLNELTGTCAQVEIFSAALSHIQLIEEQATSHSDARRQLLALDADALYRVSYA